MYLFSCSLIMAGNMEELVPVYTSLSRVYEEGPLLEEAKIRYKKLKQKFVDLYGQEPELYARAPGPISCLHCRNIMLGVLHWKRVDWEWKIDIRLFIHTLLVGVGGHVSGKCDCQSLLKRLKNQSYAQNPTDFPTVKVWTPHLLRACQKQSEKFVLENVCQTQEVF